MSNFEEPLVYGMYKQGIGVSLFEFRFLDNYYFCFDENENKEVDCLGESGFGWGFLGTRLFQGM